LVQDIRGHDPGKQLFEFGSFKRPDVLPDEGAIGAEDEGDGQSGDAELVEQGVVEVGKLRVLDVELFEKVGGRRGRLRC